MNLASVSDIYHTQRDNSAKIIIIIIIIFITMLLIIEFNPMEDRDIMM
jgi:hypothetical protein